MTTAEAKNKAKHNLAVDLELWTKVGDGMKG